MKEVILEIRNISKSFGGIKALQDVSFDVLKGRVLALVGENGAGKSTLMKILTGSVMPDSGTLTLEDEVVSFSNPYDAAEKGISIVYQEPTIFGDLNVAENLFLGNEPLTSTGAIDWNKIEEYGTEALKRVGLPSSYLSKRMNELSIGNQQLVLIAKGVYRKCKILILDEPTSILSKSESTILFEIIDKLKSEGTSIIYISHRMEEIFEISDDIVVLRDGIKTEELLTKKVNNTIVLKAMSGREINTEVYKEREKSKDEILKIIELTNKDFYSDISLSVYKGEILGIYGLVGSGRSELMRTIFGDLESSSGKIYYENQLINNKNPREAVKKGIYYLPEDRGVQGLFKLNSVKENLTVPFIDDFTGSLNHFNNKKEKDTVQKMMELYNIKAKSMNSNIFSLSGGNQQKVLFCRWLLKYPNLLILDEPTRGIDVATKTEMHKYIMDLSTNDNISIILISSDITEVMALSDRVAVMKEGKLEGIINRDHISEEKILKYAIGL